MNIIERTPSNRFMVLNYGTMSNSSKLWKIPVFDSFCSANNYRGNDKKVSVLTITDNYYKKLMGDR